MFKRKIDVGLWEINELVRSLGLEINKVQKIDTIVAISRGGLIPARYLARPLGVRRIHTIGIEFYTEEGKTDKVPRIYQSINTKIEGDVVLIVDDIVESSKSMKLAINELKAIKTPKIVTCSLHYKEITSWKPDFYGRIVPQDVWLKYPWE